MFRKKKREREVPGRHRTIIRTWRLGPFFERQTIDEYLAAPMVDPNNGAVVRPMTKARMPKVCTRLVENVIRPISEQAKRAQELKRLSNRQREHKGREISR